VKTLLPVGSKVTADPLPIFALPQACSAASVVVFCSFAAVQVGRPLVVSERFLSKSMTSWTAGLGTPLAAVVVPVFTSTLRLAGDPVFLKRAFGETLASIDCVLPSGPVTVSPASAAEAVIAIATGAARLAIRVKHLRIELLLDRISRIASHFPQPDRGARVAR
jgi:hypothetical protein